jgi:protein TonB
LIEYRDEPELRSRVAPVYPARALSRGIEGYVIVEFDVKRNGSVSDPNVVYSSSNLFDRAAVQAVMKYEYVPQLEKGIAVDTPGVRERVNFILPSKVD